MRGQSCHGYVRPECGGGGDRGGLGGGDGGRLGGGDGGGCICRTASFTAPSQVFTISQASWRSSRKPPEAPCDGELCEDLLHFRELPGALRGRGRLRLDSVESGRRWQAVLDGHRREHRVLLCLQSARSNLRRLARDVSRRHVSRTASRNSLRDAPLSASLSFSAPLQRLTARSAATQPKVGLRRTTAHRVGLRRPRVVPSLLHGQCESTFDWNDLRKCRRCPARPDRMLLGFAALPRSALD